MDLVDRVKSFFGKKQKPEFPGYPQGIAVDFHMGNGRIYTGKDYSLERPSYIKKEYSKPTVAKNDPLTKITF